MIQWNEDNGIKVFRLSSELFPHKTNPEIEDYTFDFALEKLQRAGALARKYNQRITFHPGQYNVLGTPNESALKKTIDDLTYHATVLDLMGMDDKSLMTKFERESMFVLNKDMLDKLDDPDVIEAMVESLGKLKH